MMNRRHMIVGMLILFFGLFLTPLLIGCFLQPDDVPPESKPSIPEPTSTLTKNSTIRSVNQVYWYLNVDFDRWDAQATSTHKGTYYVVINGTNMSNEGGIWQSPNQSINCQLHGDAHIETMDGGTQLELNGDGYVTCDLNLLQAVTDLAASYGMSPFKCLNECKWDGTLVWGQFRGAPAASAHDLYPLVWHPDIRFSIQNGEDSQIEPILSVATGTITSTSSLPYSTGTINVAGRCGEVENDLQHSCSFRHSVVNTQNIKLAQIYTDTFVLNYSLHGQHTQLYIGRDGANGSNYYRGTIRSIRVCTDSQCIRKVFPCTRGVGTPECQSGGGSCSCSG